MKQRLRATVYPRRPVPLDEVAKLLLAQVRRQRAAEATRPSPDSARGVA